MNTTEIRDAFESFVGTDRFNKFIAAFHSPDRRSQSLRYWQSKLWSEFLAIYPGVAPTAEDIPNLSCVFNFCPLHRVEFKTGTATVVNGFIPFEPQLAFAKHNLFPFDNRVVYANLAPKGAETVETTYCPACRDAYDEWSANDTLHDARVSDTFETKDGRIVAAFHVPFQASHKLIVGTRVSLSYPDGSRFQTRITDLERSRDCFNDGSSGLKTISVIFADVVSADQIPVGTILSFELDA